MKLHPAAAVCCLVLVFLFYAALVEARSTPSAQGQWSSMFVFGDDFADNGNLPKLKRGQTPSESIGEDTTRQWSYPYGSYLSSRGPTPIPSGRFSNYHIQSDFIARILGLTEAPPAYVLTPDQSCDPSGMTLAFGGAGVHTVSKSAPTLTAQVNMFTSLVNDGVISKDQLRRSIALVAISGNDYLSGADVEEAHLSSFSDMNTYIGGVTSEIVKNVERLQKLGLRKVIVNNLHPIGCTPLKSSSSNYTTCDLLGNYGAALHNNNLERLMGRKNNAHILDLYTAFTDIVNHASRGLSDDAKRFNRNLAPCCVSAYDNGYCGQRSPSGERLYELCENPDKYFYWDEMHPTNAGWKAVMKALEEPLKEFLDRDYVP
ncbi:hypothetical protein QYE76_036256 [Lolium multiflorum]|uniref:GDSL esterase/lipase n=1 Tax=Lolium multiflorum TaxID=4521 RepID=A0AAD8R4K6_LOLMU|nr:hypothetical protein QYE76_036256 [Lolium multiflorum]